MLITTLSNEAYDMRNYCLSCLLLGFLIIPLYFIKNATNPVGFTYPEIQYEDPSRIIDGKPRPLTVVLWYPTNNTVHTESRTYGFWKIDPAAIDAPIATEEKLPLILFSHGYGGDPYGNSWFAHYVASHGYIVACVKHYGNAYNNIIPQISARPWNRPLDMSLILDHLLADERFKKYIDSDRIGAAGFSQGGITALWLAGAQANVTPQHLRDHMATIKDDAWRSMFAHYTHDDIQQANLSYRDERIKAVCAMAPGIDHDNWMFFKEGINSIHVPVCLIVGDEDTTVSAAAYTKFFAQHIATAQLTILHPHITHWTFMNESTEEGKTINPLLTVDNPSVNRTCIHKEIGAIALHFFDTWLKA
jgi:predicted dienelactone hydrolase